MMNKTIAHVAVVGFVMFALLFGSTSVVQFAQAQALRTHALNNRAIIDELSRHRGPILIDGTPIAYSEAVDDDYEYQRLYGSDGLSPIVNAHVTGFFSISSGVRGLEKAKNEVLAGTDDSLFYDKVSNLLTGKEPMGAAVETTINPKAQKAAWDALGGQKGAVVALDPQTGDVLAMVSSPSYNPNTLATHDVDEALAAYKSLVQAPGNPLYNRAIGGNLYPPGSTFKLITAAAALESGEYTPKTQVIGTPSLDLPLTDSTIRNSGGHGCGGSSITLSRALQVSCNTSFAKLGMDLGADALAEEAHEFGFGEGFDIPLSVTPSTFPNQANKPQLAQSALGQFEVRATPLQMAMVSAAIANNGVLMKPQMIDRIRNGRTLDVISTPKPEVFSKPISRKTAKALTGMMVNVVEKGTGKPAQISGAKVAGKTGTAQHAEGAAPHAWFTAFAPAKDPKVAVAVVVEDGGNAGSAASGGQSAGPIARAVMKAVISK